MGEWGQRRGGWGLVRGRQCREAAVEGRQTAQGRAGTKGVVGGLADGGLQGRWGARDAAGLGVGAFLGVCPAPAWGNLLRSDSPDHRGDTLIDCAPVSLGPWVPLSPQSLLEAPSRAPCPSTTASC